MRGEIEQMQGRIRYLSDVTAMSTLTIVAHELNDFTPPVRPTFLTELARTFRGSLENLAEFGRAVALAAVAIVPWLPVLALIALPIFWIVRRRRARIPRP